MAPSNSPWALAFASLPIPIAKLVEVLVALAVPPVLSAAAANAPEATAPSSSQPARLFAGSASGPADTGFDVCGAVEQGVPVDNHPGAPSFCR